MGEVLRKTPFFTSALFHFCCVHGFGTDDLRFCFVQEEKKQEEKKSEEPKKAEQEKKPEEGKSEKPKSDDNNKKEEKKIEESKETTPPPPQEIVLRVYMHCEGCARKVRRCLKGFEG